MYHTVFDLRLSCSPAQRAQRAHRTGVRFFEREKIWQVGKLGVKHQFFKPVALSILQFNSIHENSLNMHEKWLTNSEFQSPSQNMQVVQISAQMDHF